MFDRDFFFKKNSYAFIYIFIHGIWIDWLINEMACWHFQKITHTLCWNSLFSLTSDSAVSVHLFSLYCRTLIPVLTYTVVWVWYFEGLLHDFFLWGPFRPGRYFSQCFHFVLPLRPGAWNLAKFSVGTTNISCTPTLKCQRRYHTMRHPHFSFGLCFYEKD